ncbi:unnamed protein product [Calypogeia fissa]
MTVHWINFITRFYERNERRGFCIRFPSTLRSQRMRRPSLGKEKGRVINREYSCKTLFLIITAVNVDLKRHT